MRLLFARIPPAHLALRQQFSLENPENPRFRCCCGCCHVTTGGVAIVVTKMLFALLYAVRGVVLALRGEMDYTWAGTLTTALAMLGLLVLGLLLAGILKEKPLLLLPYLIYQLLTIFLQFAMLLICIFYLFLEKHNLLVATQASDYQFIDLEEIAVKKIANFLVYAALALYVSGAFLGCWFFYVILYCYLYLKDKRNSSGGPGSPTELQTLTRLKAEV